MQRDDSDLLQDWRSGDKKAGDQLFDRYYRPIRTFFRNKVTAVRDHDDLIQTTFERCLKGIAGFRGESKFRTFLFAVARNTLLDYLRQKHKELDLARLSEVSVEDLAPGPSSILVKHRQKQQLVRALRLIPVDDQIMLEVYYWEELSASEIGEMMEMPEGTVRGRVKRAKEALETALKRLDLSPQELQDTIDNLDDWLRSIRELL